MMNSLWCCLQILCVHVGHVLSNDGILCDTPWIPIFGHSQCPHKLLMVLFANTLCVHVGHFVE